jgi:hypothetical protein
LPSVRSLRGLAELCGPYPIRARHVVLAAERYCYGVAMITFLAEFSPEELFVDYDDLLARCLALRDYLCLPSERPPAMERLFR